ncbi:unnamed protein product [Malus baccata var. baccata]
MAGSEGGELKAPVFNGDNFDFWLIKMKTIFRSHELWDLVESGYETPARKEEELTETEKKLMRENVIKDARALGIIQGAVSDQILSRITTQENLSNQRIVWKLLISLPKSYYSIAAVIENTKDLDTIDAQDVVAIQKGYEQRLDRHGESSMEKAFASLNIAPKSNRFNSQSNRSKHQKNFKPKGKQWGNKAEWGNKASFLVKNDANNTGDKCKFCDRLHYGECWIKNKVKCHKCNKIGHIARYCNSNKVVQQVNFANQVEEIGNLFYANHSGEMKMIKIGSLFYACNAMTDVKVNHSWYIDSGCSNHMTGDKRLLTNIKRNLTSRVKLGTGAIVQVVGNGTLVIKTKLGRKHIQEVILVSGLEKNLLSVGQMMEHGYYLLFGGNVVNFFNGWLLDNLVVRV